MSEGDKKLKELEKRIEELEHHTHPHWRLPPVIGKTLDGKPLFPIVEG